MVNVGLVFRMAIMSMAVCILSLWFMYDDFGGGFNRGQERELRSLYEEVSIEVEVTEQTTLGRVNINVASLEQLMTLDGIGESRAAAIIAYRNENGGFITTAQLLDVPGIGIGIYNKIRYRVSIN